MQKLFLAKTSILGVRGRRSFKKGSFAHLGGRFFQFLQIGWVESKNACQQSRRAQKNRGSVFWSFIDSTDSFRENWIFVKNLRKF